MLCLGQARSRIDVHPKAVADRRRLHRVSLDQVTNAAGKGRVASQVGLLQCLK